MSRHAVRPALLAATLLAACASEQAVVRPDPPPRTREKTRGRELWCVKLAEATLGARSARDVIQAIRISPRFDADEETLAPLLSCQAQLASARSGAARRLTRPLGHAVGVAIVQSRALDEAEKQTLLGSLTPMDIAVFWRAELALRDGDPTAALALLDGNGAADGEVPHFAAATLLRAAALAGQGRDADALTHLGDGANLHAAFDASIRALVHERRGKAADALRALDTILTATLPPAGEDDLDALALRSLPLPAEADVQCRRGALLDSSGQPAEALTAYRLGGCDEPLVAALVRAERFFDALLELKRQGRDDPSVSLAALTGLRQTRTALHIIERQLEVCDRLQGGARCEQQRARADELKEQLGGPGHRDADYPGLLARLGDETAPPLPDDDTDEDGLYDGDEARLCVSPASADTDGDGMLDGDDGIPTSPGRADDDDDATIITGILGHLLTGSADGLLPETPPPLDGKLLFVSSDVPPLAEARPPLRMAVLPREGIAVYRARWGEPRNLIDLGDVVRDAAGTRALVEWRWGFRAGTYLGRLDADGWSIWPIDEEPPPGDDAPMPPATASDDK